MVQGLRDEVIHALDKAGEWHPPAPAEPEGRTPTSAKPSSDQESVRDEEFRPKQRGRSGMYDYNDGPSDEHEEGAEDEDDRWSG